MSQLQTEMATGPGPAPGVDLVAMAKALGIPNLSGAGGLGADTSQALLQLGVARPEGPPPAKIARTDLGPAPPPLDLSSLGSLGGLSLASLGGLLSQPMPQQMPQLQQLPPQLAALQPPLQPPLPPQPLAPMPDGRGGALDATGAGLTVSVTSHLCRHCNVDGKLSLYCVSCGHCGTRCAECGDDKATVGALDPGNNMWYCKECWIKNTPDGVEGPFMQGDQAADPSAKGSNGEGGDSETVAAPSANDSAKKAHWAQVFATLQQVGQSHQALEYAQGLRKLRGTIQELFAKYKEALASEDELLQKAYTEALDAYKAQQEAQEQQAQEQAMMGSQNALLLDAAYQQAMDLQVQAHQEVEAHAAELQRAVQGAHQKASVALASAETAAGRPKGKLPRRPGQQPCKFYMRTGDCAYGVTCKWDHPERAGLPKPPVNLGAASLAGLLSQLPPIPGAGTSI